MRHSLILAAAGLLMSTTAFAQTPSATTQTPSAIPQAATPQNNTKSDRAFSMRANIREMLQKEGFVDIHLMPSSFIIQAKDKEGNPVSMSVSPDSFTEVMELNGDQSMASKANTPAVPNGQFVTIQNRDELSSNLVGLDIFNEANVNIGTIKDIAMDTNGRARAYVVSVGGFLGMGERYVAVNTSAVKAGYNETDKKWHASMTATADQLKTAPEFKYGGHWSASRT